MKAHVVRNGKLVASYVPLPIVEAIHKWISQAPERDISTFVRTSAREKLEREGISFDERASVPTPEAA